MRSSVSVWWTDRRSVLLPVAVALMAVLAGLKIGDELRRLLFDSGPNGAIDLRFYQAWVINWFAGDDIYRTLASPYFPASLPILKALGFGWFDEYFTRWLWALSSVFFGALFVRLLIRESLATSRIERVFVALMFLSMNATGVIVGNGQLTLHLLCLVSMSLLVLQRHARWDIGAVIALVGLLLSLVKPTISVPFMVLLLVLPRGVLAAIVIGTGYAVLTLFAATFQPRSLRELLRDSVGPGRDIAMTGGYANLQNWLQSAGLAQWSYPAAAVVLVVFGVWLFRHRAADIWILLGVTGIVARMWIYHRVYDDALLILPMLALMRIAKRADSPTVAASAGVLLAVSVCAMLAPARLELAPAPWRLAFTAGHALLWTAMAIFLVAWAPSSRTQLDVGPS